MREIKRAFSLIELLIVIVIIGVVYSSAMLFFSRSSTASDEMSLANLAEGLRENYEGYIKLSCSGDRCESCLISDESGKSTVEEFSLFEEMPKLYFVDKSGYLDTISNDQNCFVMERFANGSTTNTLLEHQNRWYIYYPLIKNTEIFESFDEAKIAFLQEEIVPQFENQYFGKYD